MAATAQDRQQQKNQYLRDRNAKANDCAPIPAVTDPARRDACRDDLRLFCLTYFLAVFPKAFSDDHLLVIKGIEEAVMRGGQMALAMPRAHGKTTLCEIGAIWAMVYGHRRYVVIVGATGPLAKGNLRKIKGHFETNELLAADFPEVCIPIQKLERTPNKAQSQTCGGEPTFIEWKTDRVVLPTVAGSVASGAYIDVVGITGAIRGRAAVHPQSGKLIRPDLVIIDDFQTAKSARAAGQCEHRLSAINSDIMGLAGPGESIAAFACVTVIEAGDAADRLLDRKQFPQWRGRRTKLMRSLPTNTKRWEEYAEVWATCLRRDETGGDISEATAFYVEHKAELDEGAEASWRERYEANEASAIQHGMNLRLKGEAAFWAEYQNEPVSQQSSNLITLSVSQCAAKVITSYPRGFVPDGTLKLTAFIDVQKDVLFWVVVAWGAGFRGHVVDYGTWPEQGRVYFSLRDLTATIPQQRPDADYDGQLYHALDTLTKNLLSRKFCGTDPSTPYEISRLLIDDNWGPSTELVRLFVRQSEHRKQVITSQGVGVTAKKRPFADYQPEDGVRVGSNWRHNVRTNHLRFDANAWKLFVFARLLAGMGEAGSLTIFAGSEVVHRLLFEHITAEFARPMTDGATGRTVNEFEKVPNRDNHWLDGIVGCAVAASEQGIVTQTVAENKPVAPKRRRMALTWT